jgi:hypothetical protein
LAEVCIKAVRQFPMRPDRQDMAVCRDKPKVMTPKKDLLAKFTPRTMQRFSGRKNARLELFARHWNGTIDGTLKLCARDGISICKDTATDYLRDPRFIDAMRHQQAQAPGAGIWTVDELKRFLTRVAAGVEPDGYSTIILKEPIFELDDDYDVDLGGEQWRRVEKHVPRYPRMGDRTRAAELLGKALAAFVDRVDVSGEIKWSVADLLDDDLKSAKPIYDLAQVVDNVALISHNSGCVKPDTVGLQDLI